MTLLNNINNKRNLAHEEIEDSNPSNNIDFQTIISRRLNRRSLLKGGTGLTAAAFLVRCRWSAVIARTVSLVGDL